MDLCSNASRSAPSPIASMRAASKSNLRPQITHGFEVKNTPGGKVWPGHLRLVSMLALSFVDSVSRFGIVRGKSDAKIQGVGQ